MAFGLHFGLGIGMANRGGSSAFTPIDFTTGSLDPRVTFTRASAGTRFNASGVLVSETTDAPRFGYRRSGGSWVAAGLLIEPAATNLCLYSNTLTNAAWLQIQTPSPTANVTGPDGVSNSAWTLTDNLAGSVEILRQSITLTAATHTFSTFVKKTTGAQASYPVVGAALVAGTHAAFATIDTSNGTATVWTAYTGATIVTSSARITDCGDYWRVELTYLATAADWYHSLYPAGTANATQSTGVLSNTPQGSAVFFGAQVETGSKASSYIATTSATVTRAADAASITVPSGVSTLRYTFDDDSTQDVSVSPGAYTVSTNLNRANIKTVASV